MSLQGSTASPARDAGLERGLRSFFEYRDLSIAETTL